MGRLGGRLLVGNAVAFAGGARPSFVAFAAAFAHSLLGTLDSSWSRRFPVRWPRASCSSRTGQSNTIVLAGMPRGQHKVLIELVDAEGNVFTARTVTFHSPGKEVRP